MSDGTAQGTRLAVETLPGAGSLYPTTLFALGDTLYFVAYDPDRDEALWRTDGTQAGTLMLTDSTNADAWFSASHFVALGNLLFFRGDSDAAGYEPWISDGTVAGTHVIKDIRPGYKGSFYYGDVSAALGGFVYFEAMDGSGGEDLWKTDGTEAGTVIVKDLNPGSGSSGIGSMVALDETLAPFQRMGSRPRIRAVAQRRNDAGHRPGPGSPPRSPRFGAARAHHDGRSRLLRGRRS